MNRFANPTRFLSIARPLTPWLLLSGLAFTTGAVVIGLFYSPEDYLQGELVRMMYVHVPSAWLGMAGWAGIFLASLTQLVWRHPLAGIAARAMAAPGAFGGFGTVG